jgi:hypothetical protein
MSGNVSFQQLPGAAKDVAVGGDGSVWVIGTNPVGSAGDFGIFRFNGTAFEPVDGGGVRIAVAPDGLPFAVNSKGQIFRGTLSRV